MSARLSALLFQWLLPRIAGKRPPDFIVGGDSPGGAYLLRWYVTPWRGWFAGVAEADRAWWQRAIVALARRGLPNLYLHKFLRDDDDRALHDHPSCAASFILHGGYVEHTIAAGGIHLRRAYAPGAMRFMRAGGPRAGGRAHRIELHHFPIGAPEPCWTLFMFGPKWRDWGFHCPQQGWVPWQKFTAAGNPGEVGQGCDA